MEYERKGVTIDWQIQNVEYIYLQDMELYSPVFSVDVMDGTKWKLVVYKIFTGYIWLAIKREAEDNGPEDFGLDYQFSINALQGSTSTRNEAHSCTFKKDQKCPTVCVIPPKTKDSTLPDPLNIQCKIWRQQGSISKSGQVFAQTRMKTESCEFVAEVENFGQLSVGEKKTLKNVSTSAGEELMTVSLAISGTYEFLNIKLISTDNPIKKYFKLKVFILDTYGNKTDIGKLEREFVYTSPMTFPLPVSKERLLEKAAQLLGIDTLSLQFKLTFCSGKEYEKVERILYETESNTEVEQTEFSKAVEVLTSKKGIPCDTKIQTATETFPAHTAVLSAKSPVFEAMFNSNMKETIEKRAHMDDVDAKTVKRMLVFLYADTMEDLDWKDTLKLYIAADKYQILSLKQKCTDFLEQSLDLSNCCVLLHLINMHQDNNLKIYVQGFIAKNRLQVSHCEQWKELEKKLPQSTNEILRDPFTYEALLNFFSRRKSPSASRRNRIRIHK